MTSYGMGDGLRLPVGQRFFCFVNASKLTLSPTQPPT